MVTAHKKQVSKVQQRMREMIKYTTAGATATLVLWCAALKCEHMHECVYCTCEYALDFKFTENKRPVKLTE